MSGLFFCSWRQLKEDVRTTSGELVEEDRDRDRECVCVSGCVGGVREGEKGGLGKPEREKCIYRCSPSLYL